LVLKIIYGSDYDFFYADPPENWDRKQVEFEGIITVSYWPD